jgi:hypothetical protein
MLRALGGEQVFLRMPTTAAAAGVANELGVGAPAYQDYAMGPVMLRRMRPKLTEGAPNQYELLISASAVANLLATLAISTAEILFQTAAGVVLDDEDLKPIESIASSEAFGEAYMYRLLLRDS